VLRRVRPGAASRGRLGGLEGGLGPVLTLLDACLALSPHPESPVFRFVLDYAASATILLTFSNLSRFAIEIAEANITRRLIAT